MHESHEVVWKSCLPAIRVLCVEIVFAFIVLIIWTFILVYFPLFSISP